MSPAARLDFPTTNNISEYEALLLGLHKAKCIIVKSDSRLMAGHFDKSFTARVPEMVRYLAAAHGAAKHFLGITVQTIPRGNNEAADEPAKLASSAQRPPPNIFYEVLRAPSAAPEAQGAAHGSNPVLLINEADWRDAIAKYLKGEEPEDPFEAKRLQHGTRNYCIVDGLLYKGGV